MTPLVAIFKMDISKGTPEVVVIELPDIDLKLPVVGIGCVKEAVGLQSRYISSPTFSALADSFIDRFEAEDRVALTNLLLVGIFTRVVTELLPVPKFTISSTLFLSSADIYPAVVGGSDRGSEVLTVVGEVFCTISVIVHIHIASLCRMRLICINQKSSYSYC